MAKKKRERGRDESTESRKSAKTSKDRKGPKSHLREEDFATNTSTENNEDYIAFEIEDEDTNTESDARQDNGRRNTDNSHSKYPDGKQRKDEEWKRYLDDRKPRPWVNIYRYRKAHNIGERLNMEMRDLVEYLSPTEEEHIMRRFAVHRIRQCTQRLFPSSSLEVFGSFETKLYLPTSDIDLVLFYDGKDSGNPAKVLSKLAERLRSDCITYVSQVIAKAKVPIIKFEESFTGYKIDISLNIANGLDGAEAVKEMIIQAPALGPLTLIFKHWLALVKMNEVFTGGLGSYAVVLMVMSCLQTHPKVDMADSMDNLGVLFVDLLELYGQNFNLKDVGIDVAQGGYYIREGNRASFAVRDPSDPSNDVSGGSFNYSGVRRELREAFQKLTKAMTSLNRQVWDYHRKDDGVSLLGCIIYVDQEAIDHRKYVHEVYSSQEWKSLPEGKTFAVSDNESSSAQEQVVVRESRDLLDRKGKKRANQHIVYVLEDEDREFRGEGNAWSSGDEDNNLILPQLS